MSDESIITTHDSKRRKLDDNNNSDSKYIFEHKLHEKVLELVEVGKSNLKGNERVQRVAEIVSEINRVLPGINKPIMCTRFWQGSEVDKVLEILSPEILLSVFSEYLQGFPDKLQDCATMIGSIAETLFFKGVNVERKVRAVITLLNCTNPRLSEFKASVLSIQPVNDHSNPIVQELVNTIANLTLGDDDSVVKAAYGFFPGSLSPLDPVFTEEHWNSALRRLRQTIKTKDTGMMFGVLEFVHFFCDIDIPHGITFFPTQAKAILETALEILRLHKEEDFAADESDLAEVIQSCVTMLLENLPDSYKTDVVEKAKDTINRNLLHKEPGKRVHAISLIGHFQANLRREATQLMKTLYGLSKDPIVAVRAEAVSILSTMGESCTQSNFGQLVDTLIDALSDREILPQALKALRHICADSSVTEETEQLLNKTATVVVKALLLMLEQADFVTVKCVFEMSCTLQAWLVYYFASVATDQWQEQSIFVFTSLVNLIERGQVVPVPLSHVGSLKENCIRDVIRKRTAYQNISFPVDLQEEITKYISADVELRNELITAGLTNLRESLYADSLADFELGIPDSALIRIENCLFNVLHKPQYEGDIFSCLASLIPAMNKMQHERTTPRIVDMIFTYLAQDKEISGTIMQDILNLITEIIRAPAEIMLAHADRLVQVLIEVHSRGHLSADLKAEVLSCIVDVAEIAPMGLCKRLDVVMQLIKESFLEVIRETTADNLSGFPEELLLHDFLKLFDYLKASGYVKELEAYLPLVLGEGGIVLEFIKLQSLNHLLPVIADIITSVARSFRSSELATKLLHQPIIQDYLTQNANDPTAASSLAAITTMGLSAELPDLDV